VETLGEEMNRILFAAARGARIQVSSYHILWSDTDVIVTNKQDPRIIEYRIHPEDLHLEYGPVSNMIHCLGLSEYMRKELIGMYQLNPLGLALIKIDFYYADICAFDACTNHKQKALFLLLLAEALADEGL
jgi:hypothetical protein